MDFFRAQCNLYVANNTFCVAKTSYKVVKITFHMAKMTFYVPMITFLWSQDVTKLTCLCYQDICNQLYVVQKFCM